MWLMAMRKVASSVFVYGLLSTTAGHVARGLASVRMPGMYGRSGCYHETVSFPS